MTHEHRRPEFDPARPDPAESDARRRRATSRARQLAELMDRRPDLFGVHPPADLVADSVRWSA